MTHSSSSLHPLTAPSRPLSLLVLIFATTTTHSSCIDLDYIHSSHRRVRMDRRMYVPPHRRSTLSITSSLDGQPPSTRESLFEGTILSLKRLHIQAPSEMASTKGTGSGTLKESQSVRRGHGRFGAPPSRTTLPTDFQARSEVLSISALVSCHSFRHFKSRYPTSNALTLTNSADSSSSSSFLRSRPA